MKREVARDVKDKHEPACLPDDSRENEKQTSHIFAQRQTNKQNGTKQPRDRPKPPELKKDRERTHKFGFFVGSNTKHRNGRHTEDQPPKKQQQQQQQHQQHQRQVHRSNEHRVPVAIPADRHQQQQQQPQQRFQHEHWKY